MRSLQDPSSFIQHVDVPGGLAAAHGRGEVNVQAEQVTGQDIRGREDALDAGRRSGFARRSVKKFFDGSATARRAKNRAVMNAGSDGITGMKDQEAVLDGIGA